MRMKLSKEFIRVTIFFVLAFGVLPLSVVAIRGGGNLHSRIHRWYAMHTSLQSLDPGQLVVNDRDADIAIIANLLVPSEDRLERATAFHDQWQSQKKWGARESLVEGIEYGAEKRTAIATHIIKFQNFFDVRRIEIVTKWEKRRGVWYLSEIDENVLEEYTVPESNTIRP